MTEAEWLACEDPAQLLNFIRDGILARFTSLILGGRNSRTKLRRFRLFVCAWVRKFHWTFTEASARNAVETVERFAYGLATRQQLKAAYDESRLVAEGWPRNSTRWERFLSFLPSEWDTDYPAEIAALAAKPTLRASDWALATQRCSLGTNHQEICTIIRDIWGNPFRPVFIDPTCLSWNNGTVHKLVRVIYDERRFADMSILADALEVAGCDNNDILAHCRSGGEHVRGCWVLDLLLGKE